MKKHIQEEKEKLWEFRSKHVQQHKQDAHGYNTLGDDFFAELD